MLPKIRDKGAQVRRGGWKERYVDVPARGVKPDGEAAEFPEILTLEDVLAGDWEILMHNLQGAPFWRAVVAMVRGRCVRPLRSQWPEGMGLVWLNREIRLRTADDPGGCAGYADTIRDYGTMNDWVDYDPDTDTMAELP